MAHIQLNNELPGIVGLLAYSPETARPLGDLANVLLRTANGLAQDQREIIASYVSWLNKCQFCCESHSAVALAWNSKLKLQQIFESPENSDLPAKMKALLVIARLVQQGGKLVKSSDIEFAKKSGAADNEIHDTVLIAAAFCMYNRYVDGLNTWAPPTGAPAYAQMGERIKNMGYNSTN